MVLTEWEARKRCADEKTATMTSTDFASLTWPRTLRTPTQTSSLDLLRRPAARGNAGVGGRGREVKAEVSLKSICAGMQTRTTLTPRPPHRSAEASF